MPPKMQNPGDQAGALRGMFWNSQRSENTALTRQTQILTARFALSPWVAHEVARLCFGEGSDD